MESMLVVEFVKDEFQGLVFSLKTLIYAYFLCQFHVFSSDFRCHEYERRFCIE